jgi:hypothetical protein
MQLFRLLEHLQFSTGGGALFLLEVGGGGTIAIAIAVRIIIAEQIGWLRGPS